MEENVNNRKRETRRERERGRFLAGKRERTKGRYNNKQYMILSERESE